MGWKRCEFVTKIEKAERATILLTGNLLSGDSLKRLIKLVTSMEATQMEYIYLLEGEDCWDWGAVGRLSLDDGKTQQKVQESVWNHEAYKWRTSGELYYEHYALVVSLIGRLTWGTDEVDDEEIQEVEESSSEEENVEESDSDEGDEEEESSSEEEEESGSEEEEESGSEEEEESSSEEEQESNSEEEESSDEKESSDDKESSDEKKESSNEEDVSSSADEDKDELKETKQPIERKVKVPSTEQVKTVKKKVKVRVPSKFLKHVKKGTVKKNYKIRVPSTFLKKNQKTLVKKKLKVRIPSKFLKKRAVVKKVNDTNTMVKKKLKVRIPSKFLKKAVKKKVRVSSKVFKMNFIKLREKKKVTEESDRPTSQKKSGSTLSAV